MPRRPANGRQQHNQRHALYRHALFAFRRIEGHQPVQHLLPRCRTRKRKIKLHIGSCQHFQLQCAGQQQQDPDEEQRNRTTRHTDAGVMRKQTVSFQFMRRVIGAEHQRHDQPDADAEHQRQDQPGCSQINTDDAAGVNQRKNVRGRRKKQKGDRRTQTRAFFINACKQRHDGAGTHRQQRSGRSGSRVRHCLAGIAPEEAGDDLRRNQRRHRAGNKKRRQQAQQHVCRKVGRQVAETAMQYRPDGWNDKFDGIHPGPMPGYVE